MYRPDHLIAEGRVTSHSVSVLAEGRDMYSPDHLIAEGRVTSHCV